MQRRRGRVRPSLATVTSAGGGDSPPSEAAARGGREEGRRRGFCRLSSTPARRAGLSRRRRRQQRTTMAERNSSGPSSREDSESGKGSKTELKVVVVGDGGCGKTSLLLVHAKGAFPEQYAPSVFEKYTTNVAVGKKEVLLHLYDTAGQEDYDRLRPLSYQNTHVVLICYDVMNPFSFDNVLIKWIHEVNHFCRGIPILLVGCKTDLRKDKEHLKKLRSAQQEPITYKQGEEACCQIGASVYLECSAKFRENVESIFSEAASIALNAIKKAKRQKKSRPCVLL